MAGHSHWAGIKHKKEIKDQKRGVLFSKLLRAISAAAKNEPNPEFNPRLRTAILKAEEASVPQDNIKRAIGRAGEKLEGLEELFFEAYGPGGVGILIFVITTNRNRSVAEIKKILNENGAKWADPGSVAWAFSDISPGKNPEAKFTQEVSLADNKKLEELICNIEENEDVQSVFTNLKK